MDSASCENYVLLCSSISEETICRLCAAKSQQTVNLFDEEVGPLDLINTISQCLQIKISASDLLPKDVCLTCCEKLREYFEFFRLCSHSQKSLAELYQATPSTEASKGGSRKSSAVGQNSESVADGLSSDLGAFLKGVKRKRKLRKPQKIVLEPVIEISESSNTAGENPTNEISAENGEVAVGNGDGDECFSDDGRATSIKRLLENYEWECTACSQRLASLVALKAHHQLSHKQLPDFKCTKCGKIYSRYRSFVRHYKQHGDPKRFACPICGKKFSQKTVLQSHSTVHTEERPHVCPQCGKAFKQFSSLYLHSRSHLPDQAKPKFHCPVCKKTFSSKHTMDNHMKIHTGEKNFACEICGKRFIAKSTLSYHILSHNDVKNHACTLCEKSFKTAGLLAKHSSLHTGAKPHQCDVCGKQFRERSALKEHARIHTGEMPYVCEYCGKAFRFKGILTGHIRQHTGERPYKCADCARTFTNWANYNKHVRRRHANQRVDPGSPPSGSLPSLDFGYPGDLPLSADVLNIHDFVIDDDIFRIPLQHSDPYSNSLGSGSFYPHLPVLPADRL